MRIRADVGKVQAAHVQFSLGTLPFWWRVKMALWSGTLHLLVEVTPNDKVRVTAVKITEKPLVPTNPEVLNGGPVGVP